MPTKEYMAVWREKNRERHRAYGRKHYALNREKEAARKKAFAKANPLVMLERSRKHRRTHRDSLYAYQKAWRHKNPEKQRAYSRKHYYKHHAKELERYKRYARLRPDLVRIKAKRRKAKIRGVTLDASAKRFYQFVRSKALIPCYYCGALVPGKDAHVDHVIALSKNGNHCSSNLAAACASCNLKKQNYMPSDLVFLEQGVLNL